MVRTLTRPGRPTRTAAWPVPPPVRGTTIVDLFIETAHANADRRAMRYRADGKAWEKITWAEYERRVTDVARGLRQLGIGHGDRVALLSANRPEWHIADMAILAAGATTVPVYQTSAASQVAYVVDHSGSRVCFVDDGDQLAKLLLHRDELAHLEKVVLFNAPTGLDDGFLLTLDDLAASGRAASETDRAVSLDEMAKALGPDDLATLVYTSGTTGHPKGAMITHGNVMATTRAVVSLVSVGPQDRFLSFLPLSHITERAISHFGQIAGGAETWFAANFATVAEDLLACRPTLFFGVPRVWEKFREGVLEKVAALPPPMRVMAERYLRSCARAAGLAPGASGLAGSALDVEHLVLDQSLGRMIRHGLGLDQARVLACGAAPIHPDLLRWFHGIGLPVIEGYGQTEVSLATTFNPLDDIRIGTVGKPIPGVAVKIADDGEILVRGDNVCAGYWDNPEATAALLDDDGWLHSGDLGRVDTDGYLHVTGRKSDLIITSYGKNIAPEEIETRLRMEPLIAQAVVVGDNRPYLTALLTIDVEEVADWAHREGRRLDLEALADDADLRGELARSVERVNAEHSRAEGIKRWRVLPHDFTIGAGELTPTLKPKRKTIIERHADLIEAMYAT